MEITDDFFFFFFSASNGKEENEFWSKVHSRSVKINKVCINSLNQANRWPIQDVGVLS